MASLDFEVEKTSFREFHDSTSTALSNAARSLSSLLTDLFPQSGSIPISKIEARVKDREECIKKFNLKYRQSLEEANETYAIQDHISDLVGARIVCLYEDDIEGIGKVLKEQFEVIDITDKIATIENTEGSFGYKGLHFDIKLKSPRVDLPEYRAYADLRFEVQVRTIVQDSWSVLDHKIKYKKSIPTQLKRRINTLAALFELADREFRQIRDSTEDEIQKEAAEPEDVVDPPAIGQEAVIGGDTSTTLIEATRSATLNAFNFLKVAKHFFPSHEFEPQKVDGFVQEIVAAKPDMTRAELNERLRKNILLVKRYQQKYQDKTARQMNPYTVIRHCLYLSEKVIFQSMLTNAARSNFEAWAGTPADEEN